MAFGKRKMEEEIKDEDLAKLGAKLNRSVIRVIQAEYASRKLTNSLTMLERQRFAQVCLLRGWKSKGEGLLDMAVLGDRTAIAAVRMALEEGNQ